ncbi:MAG: GTPase ObgE [Candidatus Bipolaricaulia bacterium]
MFLDEATVRVRGGRGGNGLIHFLSSRHNPRGGPDGGNGGPGGDVLFRASKSVSTLYSFRNRPLFTGENGVDGRRNGCQGARGEDRIVLVPEGTVVRDPEIQEILADLAKSGDEVVVARGGESGRGNASFTTAWRQGPRICERGLSGDEHVLQLELKLIADVGIIGYPNVGKSSLIRRISAVRAKVADYPFTTITPNLGVVDVDGRSQFVAVDVPGLIEGAHEGKGMGDRFLRHVERTRVFIHMIDLSATDEGRDPVPDYRGILHELEAFNPQLAERAQVVVGNKTDLIDEGAIEAARDRLRETGVELWPVSVATGAGIRELVVRVHRQLQEEVGKEVSPARIINRKVYRLRAESGFHVECNGDGFVVTGEQVEKVVRKLILNSHDALEYLTDRLERMGVLKELRRSGFKPGDSVRIGEVEFELEG